jgi:hypothetical protein
MSLQFVYSVSARSLNAEKTKDNATKGQHFETQRKRWMACEAREHTFRLPSHLLVLLLGDGQRALECLGLLGERGDRLTRGLVRVVELLHLNLQSLVPGVRVLFGLDGRVPRGLYILAPALSPGALLLELRDLGDQPCERRDPIVRWHDVRKVIRLGEQIEDSPSRTSLICAR